MPFFFVARECGRGVYVRATDEQDALETVAGVGAAATFVRRCERQGVGDPHCEALASSQEYVDIDPGRWVGMKEPIDHLGVAARRVPTKLLGESE